jgi:hypothetical protein
MTSANFPCAQTRKGAAVTLQKLASLPAHAQEPDDHGQYQKADENETAASEHTSRNLHGSWVAYAEDLAPPNHEPHLRSS